MSCIVNAAAENISRLSEDYNIYHEASEGLQWYNLDFLKHPSLQSVPVCICAYFILQFSCLKHSDTRDQFLFAFDPFLLFVLYQRDERHERLISHKSANLKAADSRVVAKSLNNVMVKLLFEKCIEFLASLFNLYESNTGTCFLLSDELYVLSDRKILATLISIRTLTG